MDAAVLELFRRLITATSTATSTATNDTPDPLAQGSDGFAFEQTSSTWHAAASGLRGASGLDRGGGGWTGAGQGRRSGEGSSGEQRGGRPAGNGGGGGGGEALGAGWPVEWQGGVQPPVWLVAGPAVEAARASAGGSAPGARGGGGVAGGRRQSWDAAWSPSAGALLAAGAVAGALLGEAAAAAAAARSAGGDEGEGEGEGEAGPYDAGRPGAAWGGARVGGGLFDSCAHAPRRPHAPRAPLPRVTGARGGTAGGGVGAAAAAARWSETSGGLLLVEALSRQLSTAASERLSGAPTSLLRMHSGSGSVRDALSRLALVPSPRARLPPMAQRGAGAVDGAAVDGAAQLGLEPRGPWGISSAASQIRGARARAQEFSYIQLEVGARAAGRARVWQSAACGCDCTGAALRGGRSCKRGLSVCDRCLEAVRRQSRPRWAARVQHCRAKDARGWVSEHEPRPAPRRCLVSLPRSPHAARWLRQRRRRFCSA
jgi:hypothetical protein